MLLVVYAGKVSEADGNVERAAPDAARAASLRQHPADATDDAQASATANLAAAGVPCLTLTTTVDTTDFAPGGTVTVTVACEASMADVTLLGVPRTTHLHRHGYRGHRHLPERIVNPATSEEASPPSSRSSPLHSSWSQVWPTTAARSSLHTTPLATTPSERASWCPADRPRPPPSRERTTT